MKKPRIPFLALLTAVFAAFTLGFFTGRNVRCEPVQIRTLPSYTQTTETMETAESAVTEPAATEPPGPVNINTASAELLQTLPGIGEVLAARIIDYREEHGDFRSVGALIHVSGIGEKKLEAIWDLITIGG